MNVSHPGTKLQHKVIKAKDESQEHDKREEETFFKAHVPERLVKKPA